MSEHLDFFLSEVLSKIKCRNLYIDKTTLSARSPDLLISMCESDILAKWKLTMLKSRKFTCGPTLDECIDDVIDSEGVRFFKNKEPNFAQFVTTVVSTLCPNAYGVSFSDESPILKGEVFDSHGKHCVSYSSTTKTWSYKQIIGGKVVTSQLGTCLEEAINP